MTDPNETPPQAGVADEIGTGLRRILAPNPSPMTHWGTNTYLLGMRDLAVIDPGPADEAHLAAILRAVQAGQRISHIFVTHAHQDHSPLAPALAQATGAPVYAFGDAQAGRSDIMRDLAASGLVAGGEGVDAGFAPDVCLKDGETVQGDGWHLDAFWTPGHFGNHMSFAFEGIVFTGDLVMGWASSLVSPPDGDLTDFMASCRKLRARGAEVFHTGHGAPVTAPKARLDWLIAHRLEREAGILAALAQGPATPTALTQIIYTETPAPLLRAAERNVLAHLVDLTQRGKVGCETALGASAAFHLV